jgi:molybdate transport system substrate-binding protein
MGVCCGLIVSAASPLGCAPGGRESQSSPTRSAPSGQPGAEILILCGSSFRPPVEKLKSLYEGASQDRLVLSFGGSEDLLPQVKMKMAGDVFVTHDPYIDETRQAGSLARNVAVGYVAPVLVTARGNPKKIRRIEDLAQPGLRVVLPHPDYSTCGKMVFDLLERKKLKDAVLANVGNAQVRSHKEVAELIKLGHRDAGIMWNGVAHTWLDAVEIIPAPYEYREDVNVGVMGLSYSKQPAAVERFLKYVEAHGQQVFAEYGYVK